LAHLKYLKFVNYALAGLCLLVAVLTLLSAFAFGGWIAVSGGSFDAMAGPLVGITLSAIINGMLAMLLFSLGGQVARAKGRGLQTLLAVLGLCNCPFGWLYAGYAIWVCWVNGETRPLFEQGYIDEY
jgi:hypothetical protein